MRVCVIIPVYNHPDAIRAVVQEVLQHDIDCFLIDDGSDTPCAKELDQLVVTDSRLQLVRLNRNGGKGCAVMAGFAAAQAAGFSHALQIDADGQHRVADIPRFVALARENPQAVIVGYPRYDHSVPKLRHYGRYLTHVWVWINTLSFAINDAMCGFRVYPLVAVDALLKHHKLSQRMDFDPEILVRLVWAQVPVINVHTHVNYPLDGVSHFRLLKDNVLISRIHATLFFGMLRRLPSLLTHKVKKRHWAEINEVTCVSGIKILLALFKLLGHRAFAVAVYPVVWCYCWSQPAARRASKQYLQRIAAIAPRPGLTVRRHFNAFAECILDKLRCYSGEMLGPVRYYGTEVIEQALARQQGGLIFCAHFGNLELSRLLAKKRAGLRLTVLVHTDHAQSFNRLLLELAPNSGVNLWQVTDITPVTAMALQAKVALGEFIVIAADRMPVAMQPRVAIVPFLGFDAPFPVGPYMLAHLLECPSYLLFAMTTKTGIEIHLEQFRAQIHLSRQKREAQLQALAADYAARLAHYCLREPLQWFNFYDFW